MRTRFTTAPAFSPFDGRSLMDEALRSFGALSTPGFTRARSAWTGAPEVRLDTDESGWTLRADLPGVRAEDLELEAQGHELRIRARRSDELPEGFRALHRERASIAFERAYEFGRGFDVDGVEARLEHGVLTVTVPRRPDEKPRKITVRS